MTEARNSDMDNVQKVRSLLREAGTKMRAHGVEPIDVALGSIYAGFDHAESATGYGIPAVEWLRTVCDVLEKSIIEGAPRSQS